MDTRSYVIVTSMGSDRPGIVEELSGWILDQGGNIENSRMSRLGGEFATLILVSGASGLEKRLGDTRERFEQEHRLAVFLKPVSGAPAVPELPVLRYTLRATSLDSPGILHQVASLLRENAISIVSATTSTSPAPFSGAPVFQIAMEIDIPAKVTITELRQALSELGRRDNIDFVLLAAETT